MPMWSSRSPKARSLRVGNFRLDPDARYSTTVQPPVQTNSTIRASHRLQAVPSEDRMEALNYFFIVPAIDVRSSYLISTLPAMAITVILVFFKLVA